MVELPHWHVIEGEGMAEFDRPPAGAVDVMIATPLEEHLVERIARTSPRVRVWYDPGLLPTPRYPGDHRGSPSFHRDGAGERDWASSLKQAEVLFGIPGDTPEGLAHAMRHCPRLRWVAATAAGAGEQVAAAGLSHQDLDRVIVTSAAGVHAGPLAEFAMFGLLALTRNLTQLVADKAGRHWPDRLEPVGELEGRTLLILGLGGIGRRTAELASAFGMRVLGVKRTPDGQVDGVEEVHPPSALPKLLPQADAVVVTLPGTRETAGLLDAEALDSLPRGALLVNVGRGAVVDEAALVERLRSGQVGGAALDVFATEPLPASSPLWALDNVIVSPHMAALSARENERIVELFRDNLRRLIAGQPLRNRIDPDVFY
jgi:glyoxylate/hydroxypyruvate reductase